MILVILAFIWRPSKPNRWPKLPCRSSTSLMEASCLDDLAPASEPCLTETAQEQLDNHGRDIKASNCPQKYP